VLTVLQLSTYTSRVLSKYLLFSFLFAIPSIAPLPLCPVVRWSRLLPIFCYKYLLHVVVFYHLICFSTRLDLAWLGYFLYISLTLTLTLDRLSSRILVFGSCVFSIFNSRIIIDLVRLVELDTGWGVCGPEHGRLVRWRCWYKVTT
jgi:hypothetical protein